MKKAVHFEKFVEKLTEITFIYYSWLEELKKESEKHKDNNDKLITLQKRYTKINTLYEKLNDLLEFCSDNHDVNFYDY